MAQVRSWRLTISRLWHFPNSSCPWRDPRWGWKSFDGLIIKKKQTSGMIMWAIGYVIWFAVRWFILIYYWLIMSLCDMIIWCDIMWSWTVIGTDQRPNFSWIFGHLWPTCVDIGWLYMALWLYVAFCVIGLPSCIMHRLASIVFVPSLFVAAELPAGIVARKKKGQVWKGNNDFSCLFSTFKGCRVSAQYIWKTALVSPKGGFKRHSNPCRLETHSIQQLSVKQNHVLHRPGFQK